RRPALCLRRRSTPPPPATTRSPYTTLFRSKTCALEHFTAMLAETILEHPEMLEGMDERVLPLWLWHAVEESEHKSVAFDVYQDRSEEHTSELQSRENLVCSLLLANDNLEEA